MNFKNNNENQIKIEAVLQKKKEKVSKSAIDNMWLLVIATVPNFLVAGYIFGVSVYWIIALSIFFCVLLERLFNLLTHVESDPKDISSIITGIIIAFLMPANIPIYVLAVTCVFSILVAKKIFGGEGHAIVNVAVVGIIFAWSLFPTEMANLPYPDVANKIGEGAANTTWQNIIAGYEELIPSNLEMFLGFVPGAIGCVSVVAIVAGGILLLITRAITPTIPFVYIGTIVVMAIIVDNHPIAQILNGTVYFAAFFLLSDDYTTPKTELRKATFAFFCAILSFIAMLVPAPSNGILVAILVMNIVGLRSKDLERMEIKKDINVEVVEKETGGY